MSWSDLFYPDNPRRREKVIQLCAKLRTIMESNFNMTNHLIDTIHDHMHGSHFLKIALNDKATVKENCEVLIRRITEIQQFLEKRKEQLKDVLDPELFHKLMNVREPMGNKIALSKTITKMTLAIGGTVMGVALLATITTGRFLVKAVGTIGRVATCGVASIAFGVLVLGIDMIASAIIGAVERKELNDTIIDLQSSVHIFEPESEKYNFAIMEIIVEINKMDKVAPKSKY